MDEGSNTKGLIHKIYECSPKPLQKVFKQKVFHHFQLGAVWMPICEICGMEVATVYECSDCGAQFCEECGDIKRKLCYDCLGWEEEVEEESWEEEDEVGD